MTPFISSYQFLLHLLVVFLVGGEHITFIKQFSENLVKKNVNRDNCISSGLKRLRKEW